MQDILQYEAVIAIIAGFFLCLFGYRVKKVAFIIIWFAIGFLLASLVAPKITDNQTWQLIIPIISGLLLGMLGFTIEKFCIFAVATYTISTTIIESFQLNEAVMIALATGIGVIVGCIAVFFIKPLGIITTALSGAKLIAKYAVLELSLPHEPYFFVIIIAASIIGILFQFKTCRHIE